MKSGLEVSERFQGSCRLTELKVASYTCLYQLPEARALQVVVCWL